MRDGVPLRAHLYRPPAAAGPLPTLVHRTPYGRGAQGAGGSLDGARLVAAGFNLVVQDVRGRFGSGGTFEPYLHEGADGADTVEWIARQPWSAPAVGMVGRSYGGAVQWLAAAERPAALRALAPEVAVADFHEGWSYQGGAFRLGFCLRWVLEDLARPTQGGPGAAEAEARLDALLADGTRPREALELLDERAPYYREWLEHPVRDEYWRRRGVRGRLAAIAAPALVVGGWYDPFLSGTLADFRAVRRGQAGGDSRLVVGPWNHGGRDGVFPARRFPGGALDLTGLHARWFGVHLRGEEADPGPAVRLYVTGADEWRGYDDWPPPGAREHRLYLGEAALHPHPPGSGGCDRFRYDPRDPVPTGQGMDAGPEYGPLDVRALDARRDVLRYSTPPLEASLMVAGEVVLVLFASSSARDTDFTARLVDVAPDGAALALCDGIVRACRRAASPEPRPLAPGAVERYEIRVGAAAHLFRPGHRIRVDVSSSNFPRFDANPNTGGPSLALGGAETVVARNAVHHGPAHPSHLHLPVLPWPG